MVRPFAFEDLIIVTCWIYSFDEKNGRFCFIIFLLWKNDFRIKREKNILSPSHTTYNHYSTIRQPLKSITLIAANIAIEFLP